LTLKHAAIFEEALHRARIAIERLLAHAQGLPLARDLPAFFECPKTRSGANH
jgi:hypothetical protein